jgi:hypothetical protein
VRVNESIAELLKNIRIGDLVEYGRQHEHAHKPQQHLVSIAI